MGILGELRKRSQLLKKWNKSTKIWNKKVSVSLMVKSIKLELAKNYNLNKLRKKNKNNNRYLNNK